MTDTVWSAPHGADGNFLLVAGQVRSVRRDGAKGNVHMTIGLEQTTQEMEMVGFGRAFLRHDRCSRLHTLAAAVTLPWVMACSHDIVCTADPKYALIVSVLDSTTAVSTLKGTTIVARVGTYVDSVAAGSDLGSVYLGLNHSGSYSLSVTKTGYKPWLRTGITVGSGECGTIRELVTVLLQPTP